MTDTQQDRIRSAFKAQAGFCREMGSALTAQVLDALADLLDNSTRTGSRILDWPGDPMVDALTLRIAGGLNALARSGRDKGLTALYAARAGDWSAVLDRVLRQWDDWLYPWLNGPPQTNEVARSAALYPGLMEIARRFGPRVELFELGASGGLNLNMDRFGYDFGDARGGDPASPVQLMPVWEGPPPPVSPVEVVTRRGVDLQPLDLTNAATADRMLAYIWPDQTERIQRAEAAIALLHADPPRIDAADGADWIEARLAEPQAEGVTRVVFHSIALQYFPPEARARVVAAIEAAGSRATGTRPLAWLSMELPSELTQAELSLRAWPGAGARELLAQAHPHGARVQWMN